MKNSAGYIVIDTNVLISAGLLPQSRTAQALVVAVTAFIIAQNEATWHELETRIAREKFDRYFSQSGRDSHLIRLAQASQWFDRRATDTASRDPTDDKFIQLAMDAGARIIVSGDPDLTAIKAYKGIHIFSPAQFLEYMNE